MLSAYIASVEFITTQADVMGPDHRCVASTQVSEAIQLTKIIRTTQPDRSDITALMKHVKSDKSNAFSTTQQQSFMEAASIRLSSTVTDDGTPSLHMDMHGSQKLQTHDYTYNYYTEDEWAYWGGTASMLQKFTRMSKAWLKWGLVFPTGPTFRTGLATLMVASPPTSTYTPTHVHALFEEFVSEFRNLRNVHSVVPTFKKFPFHPDAFIVLHPERLDKVVDCRVDVDLIRESATKEHIPIKVSNKKLTSKQPPTQAASSAGSSPREKMMEDLFHHLMGHRSPSTSPHPDRRPAVVERTDTNLSAPSTLPIGSGVVHTDNNSIVETGHIEPSTVAEHKADNATVADKLDSIDTLMDDYMSGEKKDCQEAGCREGCS